VATLLRHCRLDNRDVGADEATEGIGHCAVLLFTIRAHGTFDRIARKQEPAKDWRQVAPRSNSAADFVANSLTGTSRAVSMAAGARQLRMPTGLLNDRSAIDDGRSPFKFWAARRQPYDHPNLTQLPNCSGRSD